MLQELTGTIGKRLQIFKAKQLDNLLESFPARDIEAVALVEFQHELRHTGEDTERFQVLIPDLKR